MGIRFTTNTWRAPLQLTDCWLPVQESRATATTHPTPRLLQRFPEFCFLPGQFGGGGLGFLRA